MPLGIALKSEPQPTLHKTWNANSLAVPALAEMARQAIRGHYFVEPVAFSLFGIVTTR